MKLAVGDLGLGQGARKERAKQKRTAGGAVEGGGEQVPALAEMKDAVVREMSAPFAGQAFGLTFL
jgi:hypothetical protein